MSRVIRIACSSMAIAIALLLLVIAYQRFTPTGRLVASLSTEDAQEQKASELQERLRDLTINQDASDLFARFEQLCAEVERIDWKAFHARSDELDKLANRLDNGSLARQAVWAAICRRSYIAPLEYEARMEYARALRTSGDMTGCRQQLRKAMAEWPWFVSTWEFMIIANASYDPTDIQFSKEFEATVAKHAETRNEDGRVLSFWLNQVLKQPKTGTFHFYRSDEALALIDDLDPEPVRSTYEEENKEHATCVTGKGMLKIAGKGSVVIDGTTAVPVDDRNGKTFQVNATAQVNLSSNVLVAFWVESGEGTLTLDGTKTVSIGQGGCASVYFAEALILGEPVTFADTRYFDVKLNGTTAKFNARGWNHASVNCQAVARLEDCQRVRTHGECTVAAVRCRKVIAESKSTVRVENCGQTWAWDQATVEKVGAGVIHGSKYAKVTGQ